MENRPIYKGTLAELLKIIPQVKDSLEGAYFLFVSEKLANEVGGQLEVDSVCAIVFLLHEEDVFVPEEVTGMIEITTIQELDSVLLIARQVKPNADEVDLVKAINYYLEHDAFTSFE